MLSFEAFRMFIIVVYVWFVIGAGIIGVFAAKELAILIRGKKEVKAEGSSELKYEV
ncbi:MAG: hypothetical protein PHD70_00930 [Anaerostipes sp.]|jgi:hypothetical protein|nr:hypothetical protein [Anaerostipes sp.]MDD3745018.1 hypothetical protein [Anaerostipes sp.]